jgi:hypothetical protein
MQALVTEIAPVCFTSDQHSLGVAREEKKAHSQKDKQNASDIAPMALHNHTPRQIYWLSLKMIHA